MRLMLARKLQQLQKAVANFAPGHIVLGLCAPFYFRKAGDDDGS